MLNILLAAVLAVTTSFVSCSARADERGTSANRSVHVDVRGKDQRPRTHVTVRRRDFDRYRGGNVSFGVVIDAPWTPYPGYQPNAAWCSDPEGYYPQVRACNVPWVRIVD